MHSSTILKIATVGLAAIATALPVSSLSALPVILLC